MPRNVLTYLKEFYHWASLNHTRLKFYNIVQYHSNFELSIFLCNCTSFDLLSLHIYGLYVRTLKILWQTYLKWIIYLCLSLALSISLILSVCNQRRIQKNEVGGRANSGFFFWRKKSVRERIPKICKIINICANFPLFIPISSYIYPFPPPFWGGGAKGCLKFAK